MLAATSASAYNVIWVLIGIVTLFGSGGAFGLYRAAKRQGVRDEQDARVRLTILGDGDENKGLEHRINKRLDAQDRKLQDIEREAKPNGGNTKRLGDIAMRTERKVDEVSSKLDQHIGQSTEVHDEFRRRLVTVERRPS